MKIPPELEAQILARADHVGPSAKMPDDAPEPTAKGKWVVCIPDWSPTPVNKLYEHHWATRRRHKQSDAELVAHYAQSVPAASGKRSVALHVVFPTSKRKLPDVDSLYKSLLDALVACKVLKDDSYDFCQLDPVKYTRGDSLVSIITITDMEATPCPAK